MGQAKQKQGDERYGFLLTGLTASEMNIISKTMFNVYAKKNNVKIRILTYTSEFAKNDLFMSTDVRKAVNKNKKVDPKIDNELIIIKEHEKYKADFENALKDTLKEFENDIKKQAKNVKKD